MWTEDARRQLEALAENGLLRSLRPVESLDGVSARVEGRVVTLFCSNDYLGLAGDPRLARAAAAASAKYGFGARASRLVSGNTPIHEELEGRLAQFHRAESALLFASGFQGNLATVSSLAGKGDTVVLDRLAHASLVDAVRLSGATLKVFRHNDPEDLERTLSRFKKNHSLLKGRGEGEGAKVRTTMVLTESVFSMDGDPGPLRDMMEVCGRHDALLLVDEAHATGVWGGGRGLCVEAGIEKHPNLLRTGTLSKALGGQGGYLLAPKPVRDLVINKGRSFIYSTGLAPALCGAGLEALRIAEAEPERRERLWKRTRQVRGNSEGGAIVPVILGSSERALEAARVLWEAGFFVPAIRPPTVPKGSARLRITLSAAHTEEQVAGLAQVLTTVQSEKS